jgi:hypothetical protein
MRAILLCLLLAAPLGTASAHDDADLPLATGADLLEWCRVESQARFAARGLTAYNWTARHVERGNTLSVHGSWRVDGTRHAVECRVAKGAQREHATLQIASGR